MPCNQGIPHPLLITHFILQRSHSIHKGYALVVHEQLRSVWYCDLCGVFILWLAAWFPLPACLNKNQFSPSLLCSFLIFPPLQTCINNSPCWRPFMEETIYGCLGQCMTHTTCFLSNNKVDAGTSELCGFFKISTLDVFWIAAACLV